MMLNISCLCYQLLSILQIKEQERNIIFEIFSRRKEENRAAEEQFPRSSKHYFVFPQI